MPRPYIVSIVSDFVATPLRSEALVLSISSSSLFTILLDNKELSDPVSKIVLGTTIVLALSGAIILVFIVITSLADFRFTMPIPAGIHPYEKRSYRKHTKNIQKMCAIRKLYRNC